METKLIEIRDRGTFIPAIATLMQSKDEKESYLLERAGYSKGDTLVLLGRLDGGTFNYDDLGWHGRTWSIAHRHLEQYWNKISSGDVIDVEFILGETTQPKESERISDP